MVTYSKYAVVDSVESGDRSCSVRVRRLAKFRNYYVALVKISLLVNFCRTIIGSSLEGTIRVRLVDV